MVFRNEAKNIEVTVFKPGTIEFYKNSKDWVEIPDTSPIEQAVMDYNKDVRVAFLEESMDELRKDFAQSIAGLKDPDIENKKALYRTYYKELCELKGVQPKTI